jgi:hypothetical protein
MSQAPAHHSSNSRAFAATAAAGSQEAAALAPALYVVGTPIGNLEDMSFRAIRILQGVNLILAEDTRHTRKLLEHFAIRTPTRSCHEHNERQRQELVLQRLQQGEVRRCVGCSVDCVRHKRGSGMTGIRHPSPDHC